MAQHAQSFVETFQRGFRHHQAGQLPQAEVLYRQVLAVNPNHADSLHLLGIIARQVGQPAPALEHIETAIRLQPRAPAYHTSRGNALKDLGRTKDAEAAYRAALRLQRDFPEALLGLGGLLVELGRFEEAEVVCRKAVRARPDFHAQSNLGLALAGLGRLEDAVTCHREAIRLSPNAPEAHNNLGRALEQLDRSGDAEESYKHALRLRPDFADASNNLGGVYRKIRRLASAEACFQLAVRVRPDFAAARINLADTLHLLGRSEEAEPHGREAVRLQPESPDAHNCLGLALSGLARHEDAEACYREAIRLLPAFPAAHANLGIALKELNRHSEAEACFREALRLNPAHADAGKGLALVLLAQRKFADASEHIEKALASMTSSAGGWRVLLGTLLYVPDIGHDDRFAKHAEFGRQMAERSRECPLSAPANDRTPGRRLRVGWLSSDFHRHPVGRNLGSFFRYRDRNAFETFVYADIKKPDPMTEAFKRNTDTWRSITGLSDVDVAEMIRQDQIDIMIYLAGHFDDNRPQVAAWRPAPVQISMLDGATSGLAEMDYFLSDGVLTPAHPQEKFTERVLRLPAWYIHEAPVGGPTPGRPPCASGQAVRFASFHNPSKLHPRVFELWGELLRRLPEAQIHFQYMERFADQSLQKAIRRDLGEDVAQRAFFGGLTRSIGDHLEAYNHVDISLDPFPFTGSTATFEALWMGVPIVTLAGETFIGRMTASALAKVGLKDLIATSAEEYVDIAIGLAADPERLAQLRRTLRDRLLRSPMCDGRRAVRYFERALHAVWRKWCRDGNPPARDMTAGA